jgi:hypothetical protein
MDRVVAMLILLGVLVVRFERGDLSVVLSC